MAKFIGINHDIRHEFNIGTSNRFRGYSAKMDDRSAVIVAKLKFQNWWSNCRMVDIFLKGKQIAYIEKNQV